MYAYVYGYRQAIFVALPTDHPYVMKAENVKVLPAARIAALPFDVSSLLMPPAADDRGKLAILASNGIAWEFFGVLKNTPRSAITTKSLLKQPAAQVCPSQQQQPTTCFTLNVTENAVIMPKGQNMVRVSQEGFGNKTIRLLATNGNQHWCAVRVDSKEAVVRCPGSTLMLKSSPLKNAVKVKKHERELICNIHNLSCVGSVHLPKMFSAFLSTRRSRKSAPRRTEYEV
jgi:hypothetical protein